MRHWAGPGFCSNCGEQRMGKVQDVPVMSESGTDMKTGREAGSMFLWGSGKLDLGYMDSHRSRRHP